MSPARPPRWPRPGQVLALTAPGGAVEANTLAEGLAILRALAPELIVRADPEVARREGYFAGDDDQRAAHLTKTLGDPDVGLVMAVRGGFGCSRLLPDLDLEALAASGRALLGCSDLTCLLNALAMRGLVSLHGPMLTQLARLDAPSRDDLMALLAGRPVWPSSLIGRALRPGQARGPLLGGNLTLLCHLLGTPHFPALDGVILLLEDVGEAPYRLDRMLTQLELAGVWQQVTGVAVGSLSDQPQDSEALTAAVAARLSVLPLPVVMGLPVGHGSANRLVPLGAWAELDGDAGRLTVGVNLD